MTRNSISLLRMIPPMNDLLDHEDMKLYIKQHGRDKILQYLQATIEEIRNEIKANVLQQEVSKTFIAERIIQAVKGLMEKDEKKRLQKVINGTGTILHTNLGRAPLPRKALEAVDHISGGYSNLEFDLDQGVRGSRYSHIESILTEITGAESAMVVNNNAAAVFLCMNTLGQEREVVVSRGQQVEIGGSFRIPDIITRSGARMVEVGTTNKTHVSDYQEAINESTAILLKVHTSNFRVVGFTEQVSLAEMRELGRKYNIYVIEDLGSGSLMDLSSFGLPYEPTVQESIKRGADLVTFSGDKLLGGPQAGIIAGRKELIDRIKKNPLTRMVRTDKMTIGALEAVLRLYLYPEKALEQIPVLKMIYKTQEQLQKEAEELGELIKNAVGNQWEVQIIDKQDEMGGGSFPGIYLEGKAVTIRPFSGNMNELHKKMRDFTPPVIGTIHKDRIILSVRTIPKEDYENVVECLKDACYKLRREE